MRHGVRLGVAALLYDVARQIVVGKPIPIHNHDERNLMGEQACCTRYGSPDGCR